jgi:hypothetical protein
LITQNPIETDKIPSLASFADVKAVLGDMREEAVT